MKRCILLLCVVFVLAGCGLNNNPAGNADYSSFGIYLLKEDSIKIGEVADTDINVLQLDETPWLSSNDIDFYDYSSHYIYLKKEKSELFGGKMDMGMVGRPFIVVADYRRCYVGMFFSMASSTAPTKPQIYIDELIVPFSPADVLPIHKSWIDGVDVRNDVNVEHALTAIGKLHRGLSVTIKDVNVIANSDTATVRYTYTLTNNDVDNLYVLDPDKMGSSLFHYFTNGIDFWNGSTYIYSQYKVVERPEPFDSWKPEWFTRVASGSTIERTVVLKGYPHIPAATYNCSFTFSNPSMISKTDRILPDGRYWLGHVEAYTSVSIN